MKDLLWIRASNSGIAYWRLFNFWKAAHRMASFESWLMWWQKDQNRYAEWQDDISGEDAIKKYGTLKEMNGMIQGHKVIVWQSLHTPDALALFYAAKDAYPDKPMLVEIDDNMLSTPTYNPASEAYSPGSLHTNIVLDQIKAADGLIVSTEYLKEVYSEYQDNIYVVPNSIDFKAWDNLRPKGKKGIRIGWAGGASHNEDLEILRPVVDRILERHKDVTFVFCHGVPEYLKDKDRVEWVQKFARIDKYPQHLANQDLDIFMAPLVDNAFNRGKSNLRWLEGSALGIPTVASNVGHFKETIKSGEDGLLADTPEDFEAMLELLIKNRKLRKQMGKQANARIRKDFNVDYVVKTYKAVIDDALERGSSKESELMEA